MGLIQAVGADAIHDEAVFQQRQVEGLAVEGADHVEIFRHPDDLLQQKALLRVVPHDQLPHMEAAPLLPAQSYLKGHGARAHQPGRFRIQVEDALMAEIRGHVIPLHEHDGLPADGVIGGCVGGFRAPAVSKDRLGRGFLHGDFDLGTLDRFELVAQVHPPPPFQGLCP